MESVREIISLALGDPDTDIVDPATVSPFGWPATLSARTYPALTLVRSTRPLTDQAPERWTNAINALADVAGQTVRMLSASGQLTVEEATSAAAAAASAAVESGEVELDWTPERWVIAVQWALAAYCATCAYDIPNAAPGYVQPPTTDMKERLLITLAALSGMASIALHSASTRIAATTTSGLIVPASV